MIIFHWPDLKVQRMFDYSDSDVLQYPAAQVQSISLSLAAERFMSAEPLVTLEVDESREEDNVAYLVAASFFWLAGPT